MLFSKGDEGGGGKAWGATVRDVLSVAEPTMSPFARPFVNCKAWPFFTGLRIFDQALRIGAKLLE